MAQDYEVQDGDCVSSVAFAHGFFWETLWNHAKNSSLKEKRKDPNILKAGDALHIPDPRPKEESCATEQKHRFKLKGVPAKLRLRLVKEKKEQEKESEEPGSGADESSYADPPFDPKPKETEPCANVPYTIEIDGVKTQGSTDGDGRIEVPLPPHAQNGRLVLNPGTPEEEAIPLALGGMDPIEETSGVRKRLCNLGFSCLPQAEGITEDLEGALRLFQEKNGLDITGKIDGQTKSKLKELHGS